MYTQRTGSISLEGFLLVDSVTGTRDPGQLICETASTKVGYLAYLNFRVRAVPDGGSEIGNFTFLGQVSLGDRGGSVTDVDPFMVDIIFEGRPAGSGIFSYLQ